MAQPQVQTKSQTAVQEYMDTMLTDLFPSIPDAEPTEPVAVEPQVNLEVVTPDTATQFIANEPDEALAQSAPELSVAETQVEPQLEVVVDEPVVEQAEDVPTAELDPHLAEEIEHATELAEETLVETKPVIESVVEEPIVEEAVAQPEALTETESMVQAPQPEAIQIEPIQAESIQTESVKSEPAEALAVPETETEITEQVQETREVGVPPEELRYPNAPEWAQEDFDVLLFDVCGLKLAVPMETLGRIIKVEHETNNLIGRPDWFIGAYSEAEQRLFVVDTAKYIMPEKGFDLGEEGYDYIIQLQRTQWTLACKNVQTTVRIQPDQVKWRSAQGKRKWLAGTVVDHMCALLHVDSLVDLLEGEVPSEPES